VGGIVRGKISVGNTQRGECLPPSHATYGVRCTVVCPSGTSNEYNHHNVTCRDCCQPVDNRQHVVVMISTRTAAFKDKHSKSRG